MQIALTMAVGDPFQNLSEPEREARESCFSARARQLQVLKGSLEHPPHVLGQVVRHKLQDKVHLTTLRQSFFFFRSRSLELHEHPGVVPHWYAGKPSVRYANFSLAKSREGRNLPQGEAGKALLAVHCIICFVCIV